MCACSKSPVFLFGDLRHILSVVEASIFKFILQVDHSNLLTAVLQCLILLHHQ